MSYGELTKGLGKLGPSEMEGDIEGRIAQREEEKRAYREDVMARYPGIPYREAAQLYRASEPARQETAGFLEQYGMVIAVGIGGLILLTFGRR